MCLVVSYNFIAKHFPCWWTEKKAKSFTHLSSLISPKSLLQVDNATASQFESNESVSISSRSRIHSHSIYINIHMRVRVYLNHRSNLFGMKKKLYTNSNIDRIKREVCLFVLYWTMLSGKVLAFIFRRIRNWQLQRNNQNQSNLIELLVELIRFDSLNLSYFLLVHTLVWVIIDFIGSK